MVAAFGGWRAHAQSNGAEGGALRREVTSLRNEVFALSLRVSAMEGAMGVLQRDVIILLGKAVPEEQAPAAPAHQPAPQKQPAAAQPAVAPPPGGA